MEMSGEVELPVSREEAWRRINDPEVLKACIPGCESCERAGENSFAAVVKLKVGPVSARFKGTVEMTDLSPPESCKLVAAGEGGVAGFAKGSATVNLYETPAGCRLVYEAKADVGGKIAQLGARLLDGVARKLAAQFFEKLAVYPA